MSPKFTSNRNTKNTVLAMIVVFSLSSFTFMLFHLCLRFSVSFLSFLIIRLSFFFFLSLLSLGEVIFVYQIVIIHFFRCYFHWWSFHFHRPLVLSFLACCCLRSLSFVGGLSYFHRQILFYVVLHLGVIQRCPLSFVSFLSEFLISFIFSTFV